MGAPVDVCSRPSEGRTESRSTSEYERVTCRFLYASSRIEGCLKSANRMLDMKGVWVRPDVEETILDDRNGGDEIARGFSADGVQRLQKAMSRMS